MRAVILAGGIGTRLRPYTTLIPKPLVPLGGRYSILEIILMQLRAAGFTHVTLAVNHLANLIMSYFGDGSRLGLHIDYSIEEGQLGTIGPLTLVDDLPESVVVMNGDVLSDIDYRQFAQAHATRGSKISVACCRRQLKADFGVLEYDIAGRLSAFREKPDYDLDVSMGIYCIDRSVIDALPRGQRYGFDDLMLDSLASGRPVDVSPFSGFWLDIGRPDDYEYADSNFESIMGRLGLS